MKYEFHMIPSEEDGQHELSTDCTCTPILYRDSGIVIVYEHFPFGDHPLDSYVLRTTNTETETEL